MTKQGNVTCCRGRWLEAEVASWCGRLIGWWLGHFMGQSMTAMWTNHGLPLGSPNFPKNKLILELEGARFETPTFMEQTQYFSTTPHVFIMIWNGNCFFVFKLYFSEHGRKSGGNNGWDNGVDEVWLHNLRHKSWILTVSPFLIVVAWIAKEFIIVVVFVADVFQQASTSMFQQDVSAKFMDHFHTNELLDFDEILLTCFYCSNAYTHQN